MKGQFAPTTSAPTATFCPLPWVKLSVSTEGSLRACGSAKVFLDQNGAPLRGTSNFEDLFNHEALRDVRRQMLAGEWPRQCQDCRVQEEQGVRSKRQGQLVFWENQGAVRWSELIQKTRDDGRFEGQPLAVDLRLSNVCNLKCVMCRPDFSSSWEPTARRMLSHLQDSNLSGQGFKEHITPTLNLDPRWGDRPEVVDWIISRAPHLRLVQLEGGEPLLFKSHLPLLKGLIAKGCSKHLTLEYNTNGTLLTEEVFELWDHFKDVMVHVSVDGVEEEYEYIRTPARWQRFDKNIRALVKWLRPGSKLSFVYSIQLLNAANVPRFLDWAATLDPRWLANHWRQKIVFNLVGSPMSLSPLALPETVKQEILTNVSGYLERFRETGHPLNQTEVVSLRCCRLCSRGSKWGAGGTSLRTSIRPFST